MRTQNMWLATAIAIVAMTADVQAGGRARVQVGAVPKSIVAGKSFDLAIRVIAEGWTHRRDVAPTVTVVQGERKVTAEAVGLPETNHYKVSLTLPEAGRWSLQVDSRYCQTVMSPLTLEAAPNAAGASSKRSS